MSSGAIIFVEIPMRDLARAADFCAGLFGWSFEDDENVEGWHFTAGSGAPMGHNRIVGDGGAGLGTIGDDGGVTPSASVRASNSCRRRLSW